MTESIDFTEMVCALKNELILREKHKSLQYQDTDRLAENVVARIKRVLLKDHNMFSSFSQDSQNSQEDISQEFKDQKPLAQL